MNCWKDWPIAFLDTETTGLGPKARIVEMCVAVYEQRSFSLQLSAVFNPGNVDWSDPDVVEAMRINGIDQELIRLARPFGELWPAFFAQFNRVRLLVGQYVSYDVRRITNELNIAENLADPLPVTLLDTITLDWGIHPKQESYKLAEISKRWDVAMPKAHRASGDVDTCAKLLFKMMDQLPDDWTDLLRKVNVWSEERRLWREQRDLKKMQKEGQ
jgi:DNA polymerase III alpha subunit (gram-positive type)